MLDRLQLACYDWLESPLADSRAAKLLRAFLLTLILANVLAVILESVPEIERRWGAWFWWFEAASVSLFTVEYVVRIWAIVRNPRFSTPVLGRLRYAVTPLALIDLIAIVPSLILFLPVDLRFVRSVRLLRMLRIFKTSRYSRAYGAIALAFRSSREQLVISLSILLTLLLISSGLMYFAERDAQPEEFSSIPAALWWGVTTLTTIGYGDVIPITPIGRTISAVISILGIGVFALPAGILAAAFARYSMHDHAPSRCPHCGKAIDSSDA